MKRFEKPTGMSQRRIAEVCRDVERRRLEREKVLAAIDALSPEVSRAEQLLKEARAH
jgi:hypothetical protein